MGVRIYCFSSPLWLRSSIPWQPPSFPYSFHPKGLVDDNNVAVAGVSLGYAVKPVAYRSHRFDAPIVLRNTVANETISDSDGRFCLELSFCLKAAGRGVTTKFVHATLKGVLVVAQGSRCLSYHVLTVEGVKKGEQCHVELEDLLCVSADSLNQWETTTFSFACRPHGCSSG